MRILITGADGFIGKNLQIRLGESSKFEVSTFTRRDSEFDLLEKISQVDAVVHLAGINRPKDVSEFSGNLDVTKSLCQAIRGSQKELKVIFASSQQAGLDNPYGQSKLSAEDAFRQLAEETKVSVAIYRLPGVFGKWCKPNYNSVVATFCYNLARDMPVEIHSPDAPLNLAYVDDVVDSFINFLTSNTEGEGVWDKEVVPVYHTTVGKLRDQLLAFKGVRSTLVTERVGTGLTRALYSTYVSYLPVDQFVYSVPKYGDQRGVFVEMLKTPDSGQFSFFTAHPGITRGGHYHHSKTEKFLVIKGRAKFGFRHILTDEKIYIEVSGEDPQIVETIPGWSHDITNIGTEEMIVMLWANEIFQRSAPDTIASEV